MQAPFPQIPLERKDIFTLPAAPVSKLLLCSFLPGKVSFLLVPSEGGLENAAPGGAGRREQVFLERERSFSCRADTRPSFSVWHIPALWPMHYTAKNTAWKISFAIQYLDVNKLISTLLINQELPVGDTMLELFLTQLSIATATLRAEQRWATQSLCREREEQFLPRAECRDLTI